MSISETRALRFASWITAINVLVATGFSIAGLVSPASILPAGAVPSEAGFIFAMYATARTLPLAALALLVIIKRSVPDLFVLGLLAGVIQLLDAAVGFYQHDLGKSLGPLGIAVLQFYALFMLKKSALRGA